MSVESTRIDASARLMGAALAAARWHAAQRRKGERAEPYVNHLLEVAALLAETVGDQDIELVVAGLLHDAIEDQSVTRTEIAAAFGEDVAALVAEVSDDKSLPKQVRKDLQIANAAGKTGRGKLLSLADKIANLRSLAASPPHDWPASRSLAYAVWAEEVGRGLTGGNAALDAHFLHALGAVRKRFSAVAQEVG